MSTTLALLTLGILIVFLLRGKFAAEPGKIIFSLGLNSIIGIVVLWLVDFAGSYIGFNIPLNIFTVLIAGTLGVPGITVLGILQFVI